MAIPPVVYGPMEKPLPSLGLKAIAGSLTAIKVAACIAVVTLIYTVPAPVLGFICASFFSVDTAEKSSNETLNKAVAAAYAVAIIAFGLSLLSPAVAAGFYFAAHVINLTTIGASLTIRAQEWYQGSLA